MILKDFKNMLGIDGINIKVEDCCCAKSGSNVKQAQNAVAALKYDSDHGEKLFECFNSVQNGHYEQRMRKYKYVFIFMGEGELARFYALYEIKDKIKFHEAKKRNLVPDDYIERIEGRNWTPDSNGAYFVLNKIPTPGDLEGRLLVRFLSGQQNAPTFIAAEKYEVTHVEPPKIATEFINYKSVHLTYKQLQKVVNDKKWQDMLSRFGGVYLIHDSHSGKNYVGAAYNKDGILGRWKKYAENPTGRTDDEGNVKLVELLRNNPGYADSYFHYSILEVLPLSSSDNNQDILDAETRWKVHLGTRTHGLNAN